MVAQAQVEQAAHWLLSATHCVALTGAGFSTPSGIPDFRSAGSGLWQRHDPLQVATLPSFIRAPERFYDWVQPLVQLLLNAEPNPAHMALVRLEELGRLRSIITQNIDMLHGKAGSRKVYEVHGHLREATCLGCGRVSPTDTLLADLLNRPEVRVPRCERCGAVLKPNVILFGEQLPTDVLEGAEHEIRHCDLLLVAGSSLEVYPVADLPRRAKAHGAKMIIINYEPTAADLSADLVIHGDVAEVLPRIVQEIEAHPS
jgi:NAD-dependent deacetylase